MESESKSSVGAVGLAENPRFFLAIQERLKPASRDAQADLSPLCMNLHFLQTLLTDLTMNVFVALFN